MTRNCPPRENIAASRKALFELHDSSYTGRLLCLRKEINRKSVCMNTYAYYEYDISLCVCMYVCVIYACVYQ